MNPIRKQRLMLAVLVLAAAGVAALLLTMALQQNMTYLHSPSDVVEGAAPADAMFRLGGVVKEGSVQRQTGTLKVRFEVTDRLKDVPVEFEGMLPDLFREAQSVIARGRMEQGVFRAEEVLAKHDESYMPPEVAEKIAESHAKAARAKAEAARNAAPTASPEASGATDGEGGAR